MEAVNVSYLHIIPFDFGYPFCDVLAVDNNHHLKMADAFLNQLANAYPPASGVTMRRTFTIRHDRKKAYGYQCTDEIVDQSMCRVRLKDNLYAFILVSGIGCFALLDDGALSREDLDIAWNSHVFEINYIKRKTQKVILTGRFDETDANALSQERALMLRFMSKCWDILKHVAKKFQIKCVREYSSSISYKNSGLSYVLTVYLLKQGFLSEQEQKYLLYSSFTDEVGITRQKADALIEQFDIDQVYTCGGNRSRYMFSWAAVAAVLETVPQSFDEVFSHSGLSTVLKQEIYVQSRWFLADNSLDNAIRSFRNKLVGLQRLEGLLEHYEAELNNEISANMTTEEKNILRHIIHTSGVNTLYTAARRQIHLQRKLKEQHEQILKKRSVFISSLFMAIFTASTLYSEIYDIISGAKQNLSLLTIMLIIAVGTVILDYISK